MIKIFRELVREDKKFENSINIGETSDLIDKIILFVNELRQAGEMINDPDNRIWLSNTTRKWGSYLYSKADKYFATEIFDFNPEKSYKKLFKHPYKFLNYFNAQDRDIFFGRDDNVREVSELLSYSKLMVLFGGGGVGKTSLILAGLMPKFNSQEYFSIYVRCTSINLLNSMKSNMNDYIIQLNKDADICINSINQLSLPDIIRKFREINEKQQVIFFIDQFEQFFDSKDESLKEEFEKAIIDCVSSSYINTKFFISLREDSFHRLDELKIPDIFSKRYCLKRLTREQAIQAIKKPIEIIGMHYEEGLVEKIIEDLDEAGFIYPPQLQIVCDNLYKALDNHENEISRKLYESLGGVEKILADYVDTILDKFEGDLYDIAKELLKTMASIFPEPLNIFDALAETKKANWNEEKTYGFLEKMVEERLLRKNKDLNGNYAYELTHEYLLNKIKDWIDLDVLKLKQAQELLKQEFKNWKRHKIAMGEMAFNIINEHRNGLRIENKLNAFILSASIRYNIDFIYWLKRNLNNNEAIDFLFTILDEKNNPSAKRLAGIALGVLTRSLTDFKADTYKVFKCFENIVNPTVLETIEELKSQGFIIGKDFTKKIREILEYKSTKDMAFVQSGRFKMGFEKQSIEELVNKGIHKSWFAEAKLKDVFLGDFMIDKFLVTNEEYKEFDKDHTYPSGTDRHPATNINWFKAKEYAEWLCKDIPTEEEWEKAARGTDGRLFPWGNEWDTKKCNTRLSGITGTTPVDNYPEGISPYGCFDMAGNVWEWTKSKRKKDDSVIILRGGSWTKQGVLPWCSYAYENVATEGMQNIGFRCIRRIKNDLKSNKEYSAGGLFFLNKNGKTIVLLGKEIDNIGNEAWRIPKGKIDENESVVECVKREIKEETGYSAKIVDFIGCANWSYERDQKIWDESALFFVLELAQKDQEKHDGTFVEMKWFEINEAIEILKFDSEREIARKAERVYKENLKDNKGYLYDES